MAVTDPDERATRAIVLALNKQSPQKVKILKNDGNDPTADGFLFTPEELFDGTFEDVGVTSKVAINGFKKELMDALDEIADKIQGDLATINRKSSIQEIFDTISLELKALQNSTKGVVKGGGGGKGGSTKNTTAAAKGSKKPDRG
jgi:hypothetical protein